MNLRMKLVVWGTILAMVCLTVFAQPVNRANASSDDGLSLPPGYVASVNHALSQKVDYWGEQLMAQPSGPTLQDVRDLLVPVNVAGNYQTDSGWYYIPFTMPLPDPHHLIKERDFVLHVADGSQLLSEQAQAAGVTTHSFDTCNEAPECVTFYVGPDGKEVFGSARDRMEAPHLYEGYIPILENGYTDSSGVRYRRESFVARPSANGPVVSMLHFSINNSGARQQHQTKALRVRLDVPGTSNLQLDGNRITDGKQTLLMFTGKATWQKPYLTFHFDNKAKGGDIYLAIPSRASSQPFKSLNKGTYRSQKMHVANYWRKVVRKGSNVEVPDEYVENAMHNVLIQNLTMNWRLSIGNAYEHKGDGDFAYIPEVTPAVTVLGEFGFQKDYKANLQELIAKGQGPAYFPTWEKGIKLQSAAHYFQLTGDATLLEKNLSTFQDYLHEIHAQRVADPNGLLAKERTASDISRPIYGLHALMDVWRGLRDMSVALNMAGNSAISVQFSEEATALHKSIKSAVTASEEWLPDGSLYVPLSLLDPKADPAYDFITATRSGSYWNLLAPYAFATGFFTPHSEQADGILKYLYNHGSLFLGLPRFNYTGTSVGKCKTGYPAGIEGYKTTGLDGQYGYSQLKFLSQNDQGNRIALALYGKLGADMTPFTYINGEGTTIGPCPQLGEYYRTMWLPPLGGNNATFLEALRLTLVSKKLNPNGVPSILNIAPATPRSWLHSGKNIKVTDLPTMFGPVSYRISSHLNKGFIKAKVKPPKDKERRSHLKDVVLHLRVPSNVEIQKVVINGQERTAIANGNKIHLGAIEKPTTVIAYYKPGPGHKPKP